MAFVISTFLKFAGCSMACQAGILSNFTVEVGPRLDPCTVSRSGIGWPQYAGVRKRRILATLGKRWCDPAAQLGYIVRELTELGIKDRLFAMTDPELAAELFQRKFERPRSASAAPRRALARSIYRDLLGTAR